MCCVAGFPLTLFTSSVNIDQTQGFYVKDALRCEGRVTKCKKLPGDESKESNCEETAEKQAVVWANPRVHTAQVLLFQNPPEKDLRRKEVGSIQPLHKQGYPSNSNVGTNTLYGKLHCTT